MNDKLINSAHQLGVVLGIPMYIDPETGFNNSKEVTWENGDKIKVTVNWADGAFYYTAYLGQIDPKTNEMSFISGSIAEANSLESLIGGIDGFLKDVAQQRNDTETSTNFDVTEPIISSVADMGVVNNLPSDETGVTATDLSTDEVLRDYQDNYSEYQDLLLDPGHDHDAVYEMSVKLSKIETKLRQLGINPIYLPKG